MIKRFMNLFGKRPSNTLVRTDAEIVTNPMSDKLVIGVSIYAPAQEPRSRLEKSNTWECMSDMSDDLEVVQINHEENEQANTQIDPKNLSIKINTLSPNDRRLLRTPSITLAVNEKGLFSVSPDGVEDLDEYLDDSSSYSGLSPIIM
ncbi:MAG: hypothetical protein P1U36_05990 [Legionellaceae bacterium]|nr:hypothetical protein [Legionellaceae bacterium]